MSEGHSAISSNRWAVLTLAALTHTLCVAMPVMCMPVLFNEISKDLGLGLVQVGTIWGIGFLPGIAMGMIGGGLGDRFGTKSVLRLLCILAGVGCAVRGLSSGFATLAAANLLFGFLFPAIPMNVHKTCGMWFESKQLGMANGVVSMGMALGFMATSMISATVMSPLVGGWSNVLFLYGAVSAAVGVAWHFSPSPSGTGESLAAGQERPSLREAVLHVLPVRNVWFLGVAIFGFGGCAQGMLGYLPLYLREMGWSGPAADNALATFHGVSMAAVIPIALMSDRSASRKQILIPAAIMMGVGTGLLSVAEGAAVWAAVILAGIVRDGFMAVFMTTIIETKGIGSIYAGTGIGLVMVFSGLSSMIAPPAGNSLASIHPGMPFLFWSGLAALGMVSLRFVRGER